MPPREKRQAKQIWRYMYFERDKLSCLLESSHADKFEANTS